MQLWNTCPEYKLFDLNVFKRSDVPSSATDAFQNYCR
jgi:hypothetical protein